MWNYGVSSPNISLEKRSWVTKSCNNLSLISTLCLGVVRVNGVPERNLELSVITHTSQDFDGWDQSPFAAGDSGELTGAPF